MCSFLPKSDALLFCSPFVVIVLQSTSDVKYPAYSLRTPKNRILFLQQINYPAGNNGSKTLGPSPAVAFGERRRSM
ncbi:uncharacterized protein LY89DRAFT_459638 [Mollisia scopiformis]|uniref:Uncharacterized protein n=1 Tax=Mollisia scopiformis TaxID=149040 RepID=A0A194XJ16_MOLSC|nr:uncharacterized protein LY89DRAFT_459638 [Mollisia scopiformis]KUJ19752.1 hypothetical protein LY89DRAFT_459638 [Mollisia scopiformis]